MSLFSAGALLVVMVISSCELPKLESPFKLLSTSITGTVTNPAGDPVDGVEVSVGSVSVQSGEDGTFNLEGIANVGTVILSTKKAGYNDYRKFIETPAGTMKHDIQPSYAYTTTVSGKLSDPLAGPVDKSNFTITSSTGGKTATTTDPEGNYTIKVKHAGEFTLTATAPDKRLIGRRKIKAATTPQKPVSKENADPIELERNNAKKFTLELKDPLDNAVTSPVYTAADFTSSSGAAVEFDTTAPAPPQGSYKLQVLTGGGPGTFTVTVAAKGLFGEKESAEINPGAAGTNYPVAVPYRYTTTVSGRVTAGTTPIEDADISVTSTGTGANERLAAISSAPASRKTDNLGNYSITVNHQGDFNIQAEKAGYRSPTAPVTVSGTGGTETGNFALTPIRKTVTGLSYGATSLVLPRNEDLTDDQLADLRPRITPAGASVTYKVEPALPAGLDLDTSSGEITGTPTAITAAGNYVVTAEGDTAAGYSGSASHTINIRVARVTRRRGIVTGGRVTVTRFTLELKDPLGNPIPGYTAADFTSSSGAAVQITGTVINGIYPLQVLTTGPGTFTVTAAAKGLFGEKESAEINPGAAGTNYPVTVPYRYRTTVSGRVTRGAAPIENADISVTSTGSGANERKAAITSATASRKTDNLGNYSIAVNHQGDFNIRAEKAGYRSPAAPVTVSGTGGTETENFVLTPIRRTVTGLSYTATSLILSRNEDLTDAQLADLRPTITPVGAVVTYSVEPDLPAGLTLDTSSGEITGTPTAITPAGDYVVTAEGDTAAGYSGSASHTINIRVDDAVTGGGVTVTRFTLELKDPLGNPIPGYTAADFTLSIGAAVQITGTVINGIYPLQVLTTGPGTFTVTAAAKGLFGEKESADIDPAAAGTNYRVTVPYRYTTIVSGRVTAGTTTPVEDADISVTSIGTGANERLAVISSTLASRKTDNLGNYSITVNHQGNFQIRAKKAVYNFPAVPVTVSGIGGTETGINFELAQTVTDLSYTATSLVLTRNEALTPDQLADLRPSITPTGASVIYSVWPELPAGLELDESTGHITGTPTAITAAGDYLVTAVGAPGTGYSDWASHTINIRVDDAVTGGGVTVTRFTLELKDPLGNPIPGYTAADFTSSSGADVEITGDVTDGIYPLQVTATESFTVTAAAKGLFGEKESAEINPAAAAGTNYRAAVPYRYTTTVSGGVTAGTTPVEDADISVTSTGTGANERLAVISSTPASRKTDNLGNYSITVNHQGDFNIQAEKAGYRSPAAPVTVSGTGGTETENFVLTRTVTGLSYGASSLVLTRNEALTPDQLADLRPSITPTGASVTYSIDPDLPPWLTLDTSSGEIRGTPTVNTAAGDYVVTAVGNTADGYSGSASHTINIRVDAVTRFTLELRDASGSPIPGYTAADFTSSSGAAVEFDTTAPAPSEGIYPLQVTATESFTVTVAAKGLFGEKESAEINPATAAGNNYFTDVPYRYTTTVSGQVTVGTTPIENADISVTSTGTGANERRALITHTRTLGYKTDSNGWYSITVNHQGDFNIRAEKADYLPSSVPVSGTGGTKPGYDIGLTPTEIEDLTELHYETGGGNLVLVENEALTPAQEAAMRPIITPAGASVTYTINRKLPKGLNFDESTGRITGKPTRPSQRYLSGVYIGWDYTVTATGKMADGYTGSASYTMYIRVARALPKGLSYGVINGFLNTSLEINHQLEIPTGFLEPSRPHGIVDDQFDVAFVRIPVRPGCRDLSSSIAPNGIVRYNEANVAGPPGLFKYRVRVTGKGPYAGTRIAPLNIEIKDMTAPDDPPVVNCYE